MKIITDLTEDEQVEAILKATPATPIRIEIGGGYYYKCAWANCNGDVSEYDNYCRKCGQRLKFED